MTLQEHAQRLYPAHPHYQAAWLRIVQQLGSRWLLASDATPRPKKH